MFLEVVQPGHEVLTPRDHIKAIPQLIELAGRTCYKSEEKITGASAEKFVQSVIRRGHESVIEHCSITVRITCDRACSHQLVRHRIAAFSQESQRYCDYAKGEDGHLKVICPPKIANLLGLFESVPGSGLWKHVDSGERVSTVITTASGKELQPGLWLSYISRAYVAYRALRENNIPPEDARSVLPNAVKTEVVTTFNLRQWRHVFEERALNKHAQWQIREIMLGILTNFAILLPCVFEDQWVKTNE